MKKQIITFLSLPFLWLHLLVRFFGKSRELCDQDQAFTRARRGNPFSNKMLQFAYYIDFLPEYRSVFYKRSRYLGRLMNIYLPGQKSLYIRTSQLGGVFV